MTVRDYQIVYKHNSNIKDEVERMAFIVMDLFNLPYSKVDAMSKKAFLRKINKVKTITTTIMLFFIFWGLS